MSEPLQRPPEKTAPSARMARDLQLVTDLLLEEGCPLCSNQPSAVHVLGPDEIALEGCVHAADARGWLDRRYFDEVPGG